MISTQGALVGISGKIASGKDTTAAELTHHLHGHTELIPNSKALKVEMTEIVKIIQESYEFSDAVLTTLRSMFKKGYVLVNEVHHVVELIYAPVRNGEISSGMSRHPLMRAAIQYWASDVRRNHDPDYWVTLTREAVLPRIADGTNVIITDVRFPNEAMMVSDLGGTVVRIDVSPEVQAQRVMNRDGITLSPEQLTHYSECLLDDYENFDYRVLTDELEPSALALLIATEGFVHENIIRS